MKTESLSKYYVILIVQKLKKIQNRKFSNFMGENNSVLNSVAFGNCLRRPANAIFKHFVDNIRYFGLYPGTTIRGLCLFGEATPVSIL